MAGGTIDPALTLLFGHYWFWTWTYGLYTYIHGPNLFITDCCRTGWLQPCLLSNTTDARGGPSWRALGLGKVNRRCPWSSNSLFNSMKNDRPWLSLCIRNRMLQICMRSNFNSFTYWVVLLLRSAYLPRALLLLRGNGWILKMRLAIATVLSLVLPTRT